MTEIAENTVENTAEKIQSNNIAFKLNSVTFNKKIIIGAIAVICIGILFLSHHKITHLKKSIQNTKSVVKTLGTVTQINPEQNQLNDISAKLANIEKILNNKGAYVDIDNIKTSLSILIAKVNALSQANDQAITNQITQSKKQLNQKLNTINVELSDIKKQNTPHRVISASHLPFQVVSIDNIQNDDIVSVHYDNHLLPIELNAKLAGWTLIKANTEDQTAQFENKSQDYVNIGLNDISN